MTPHTYTMNIGIPGSVHGSCSFLMPELLSNWIYQHGLRYSYTHSTSGGNGITDGKSNAVYCYQVQIEDKELSSLFKIMFPECHVSVFEPVGCA